MIETVFLQKGVNLSTDNNVNIILSPELYWVRIFDIPIESKKEALNVLPNMFEDFFDIDGYKFYIDKLDNGKYLSFAYKEKDIEELIEELGLSIKQVSNIYFAQFECAQNKSFVVDGINYIYQDDILVKIPQNFVLEDDFEELNLNEIKLSKHSFFINKSSKYIESKTAYILSSLFLVLAMGIFTKGYMITQQANNIPLEIDKIKTEYKLLPTLFQTKSMLKEYEKADKNYNKVRELFEYSINFKRSFKGIVEKIELKNNQVVVIYNEAKYSDVNRYFTKKYKSASVKQMASKVKVRLSL
jgi:hypothetical protein